MYLGAIKSLDTGFVDIWTEFIEVFLEMAYFGTWHEGGGVDEKTAAWVSRMKQRRHLYASATGSQVFFFPHRMATPRPAQLSLWLACPDSLTPSLTNRISHTQKKPNQQDTSQSEVGWGGSWLQHPWKKCCSTGGASLSGATVLLLITTRNRRAADNPPFAPGRHERSQLTERHGERWPCVPGKTRRTSGEIWR